MKTSAKWTGPTLALLLVGNALPCLGQDKAGAGAEVYPTALFPLQERGGPKDTGAKVSDILFATLSANPDLYLVDREELEKTLQEQGLNLSGVVKPEAATQVGQLVGAKILITGSVVQVDRSTYLVAKIIGTETTRVVGVSVKGKASDDLSALAEQLAEKIAATIKERAKDLVAKPLTTTDRVAELNRTLGKAKRPKVRVAVTERHVGQPTIDPAAETELVLLLKETGFEVVDAEVETEGKADVLITGEGFSEFGGRVGNLLSVKARVEVKAVDRRTGRVLASDRQTAVVVDLTEQVAGKAALQQAAATLAQRLLPKLVEK